MMLSKSPLEIPPAGVFVELDSGHKILVFKLGRDFMQMEGRKWKRGG
jgi:hypothetical protein